MQHVYGTPPTTYPAIAQHKYRWHRVDSGHLKFMIADVCLGTLRVKPGGVQWGWHCTLPGIPSKQMYGTADNREEAQNLLLDIINAWFTVVDQ